MIVIRSMFSSVCIPKELGYGIYAIDESLENVTYSDLHVATPTMEFVFKRVYAGYEVASRIIRYIHSHQNDPVIDIDLDQLCEDGMGFHMLGGLSVERNS